MGVIVPSLYPFFQKSVAKRTQPQALSLLGAQRGDDVLNLPEMRLLRFASLSGWRPAAPTPRYRVRPMMPVFDMLCQRTDHSGADSGHTVLYCRNVVMRSLLQGLLCAVLRCTPKIRRYVNGRSERCPAHC